LFDITPLGVIRQEESMGHAAHKEEIRSAYNILNLDRTGGAHTEDRGIDKGKRLLRILKSVLLLYFKEVN
jgi:hypothetical protein